PIINESDGIVKKITPKKASPVKGRINSGSKSNTSPTQSIGDRVPYTINSIITSPTKSYGINLHTSPSDSFIIGFFADKCFIEKFKASFSVV
ncbi:unnamed protein product, partial [Adineta steineri]